MAQIVDPRVDKKIVEVLKTAEGTCVTEGYLKKDSVELVDFSCGKCEHGDIVFIAEFNCKVALPFVGQIIDCVVETNNHAGLSCRVKESPVSPFKVVIFRDHKHTTNRLARYAVDSTVPVEVVDSRYEVNDAYITVIGVLRDGIEETAEVEAPVWTSEIVPAITTEMVKKNPSKTYVVDNTKMAKDMRDLPNVIELNVKGFGPSIQNNKAIINKLVQELHVNKAKTLVFPDHFCDHLKDDDPDTHRYLVDKLRFFTRCEPDEKSPAVSDDENDSADY
jgi:hypothetical protein